MVKTRWRIGRSLSDPFYYFDTYAEAMAFFCSEAMNGQPTDGWAITQENIVYSDTSL